MPPLNGPLLDPACPRCGGGFELRLPEGLRADIAARWPGRCLCLACLRELGAQPVLTPPSSGAQA
jgi:hypothetical protein